MGHQSNRCSQAYRQRQPQPQQQQVLSDKYDEMSCQIDSLGSRLASLQRAAVPAIDTAAETAQEPRISGACRTISRRWSNILAANGRMMTPQEAHEDLAGPTQPCSLPKHNIKALYNWIPFTRHGTKLVRS